MGKAKYGTCHFIPLFNGLLPAEFTETESEVLGVTETRKKQHANLVLIRVNFYSPVQKFIDMHLKHLPFGIIHLLHPICIMESSNR
jgi:hypothetical protein